MEYLDFIENTRHMTPEQRSQYFNDLTEEQREKIIEQGGDIELLLLQARIVVGAEMIENEQNVFKKRKMEQVYDALCDEYLKIRRETG